MSSGRQMLFGIVLVVLGLGAAAKIWIQMIPDPDAGTILKPQVDLRKYQSLVLDNGLKVLLVSDPSTDISTAALNVQVGSYSDPDNLLGLAHFLEHMLFLGTEKYPDADDYSNFIRQHGGSNNAYTAGEETVYYFDIENNYFDGGLDRFAQFFVAPLFTSKYVEREVNAVDSEYRSGLKDDGRRFNDAYQETLNPEHPTARFSTGNLKTLSSLNLRSDLISWYQAEYSAERMSLVIYSSEALDTLEKSVVEKFSKVKNRKLDKLAELPALLSKNKLPLQLNVKPYKNLRQISMSFPVPGSLTLQKVRPSTYVSWILNNDAKGSISDILKKKGWIENLSAGLSDVSSNEVTYDIDIKLSEAGEKNVDEIITLVFDQVQLLENEGINSWQYVEMAKLQNLSFDFQESYHPTSYAVRLTYNLNRYLADEVLVGPYQYKEYNEKIIRQWLSLISPRNMMLSIIGENVKTNKTSEYYNTSYGTVAISNKRVKIWNDAAINSSLKLPIANAFVPDDLEVLPPTLAPSKLFTYLPDKYLQRPGTTLWYKPENIFNSPKMDLRVGLDSPWFSESTQNMAATDIYLKLVKESLNEISFDAGLAGLGYSLWRDNHGVALRMYGYHSKLPLYIDAVINEMVSIDINAQADRFNTIKAELIRKYKNKTRDRVLSQLNSALHNLIRPNYKTGPEMSNALAKITLADMETVKQQLNGNVQLKALVHGNLNKESAVKLGKRLSSNFLTKEVNPSSHEIMILDKATAIYKANIDHNDSAIVMYFQAEDDSFRQKALYSLLNQLMQSPFFNSLRTEKQLGYAVYTSNTYMSKIPGFSLTIQSPKTDPALLQRHIEKFMYDEFHALLSNMDEEEFDQFKAGLVTQYIEKDKNLLEAGQHYWQNIRDKNTNFNSLKRVALEVEKITRTGLIKFYENQILNDDARRLIVLKIGAGQDGNYQTNYRTKAGTRLIESSTQYQDQRPSYTIN